MPTARELLEQADALMRRNRARAVDTEIPELTEVITFPFAPPPPPPAPPLALDDIPELTDAVEEIEISSIAEMPGDEEEASAWLRSEGGETTDDATVEAPPAADVQETAAATSESTGGRVLALFADAGKPEEAHSAHPPIESVAPMDAVGVTAEKLGVAAEKVGVAAEKVEPMMAEVVELASRDATSREADAAAVPAASALSDPTKAASHPPVDLIRADDWARWEALAEEIRMQVLQRIDIFTDTGLREQLGIQLQPIVERASAEMVATVNEQVGKLIRAYIAQAIEREIETWRKGNG